jgi:hypothetical protein
VNKTATGRLVEMALTVIQEKTGAGANPVNQQVEITVAIDVGENRPRGILAKASDSRLLSDVLEPPSTQIPVEPVAAFESAEIEVTPAISIHVATRDTRTIQADLIFSSFGVAKDVGEVYASRRRRQECKARWA